MQNHANIKGPVLIAIDIVSDSCAPRELTGATWCVQISCVVACVGLQDRELNNSYLGNIILEFLGKFLERDWKFFENYSKQLSGTWVSVAGVLSKFLEIQRRSTKSIAGKSVFSPNPSSAPSVARRAFLPRGAFSECCRICWGPKTYGRSLIPICSMYTIFINIYQYLPHK